MNNQDNDTNDKNDTKAKPKHIVLLSDGTGNSSAKAQKTNVWRMFQAIDQTCTDQIAFYDDGVGTSANKYLAMIGGAFGWGLKRNVIDIYKFVCRNYEKGDHISGFGFSRGAFTIRVLVGLIDSEGILCPSSEEELDRNARSAYRHYRSARFPSRSWIPTVKIVRAARDACIRLTDRITQRKPYKDAHKHKHVPIRFLGLWDTVSAYGVPVMPLKRAIDATIWPMMFGDLKLSKHVQRACHAFSLDDERSTFHPLPWDETNEPQSNEQADSLWDENGNLKAQTGPKPHPQPGRITQVWFPGVHSNVGGGYPEDRLSLVSLHWIMSEAMAAGIRLLPHAVEKVVAEQSPFARIYDSRKGFAGAYPYLPRLALPCRAHGGVHYWPIAHWSVPVRIAHGTDRYAPVTLREHFRVLDPNGKIVTPKSSAPAPALLRSQQAAATLRHVAPGMLDARNAQLLGALEQLDKCDPQMMAIAWDTVLLRRFAYLSTLVLSVILIAFPWLVPAVAHLFREIFPLQGTESHVTTFTDDAVEMNKALIGNALNTVLTLAKGILPTWSSTWTNAFGDYSTTFVGLLALWFTSLSLSDVLRKRVRDRSYIYWHPESCDEYLEWRRRNEAGHVNMKIVGGVLCAIFAVAAYWLFDRATSVELGSIAALLFILALNSRATVRRLNRMRNHQIQSSMSLKMARWFRTSKRVRRVCYATQDKVLPGVVLLVALWFGLGVLNHTVVNGLSAVGVVCRSAEGVRERRDFDLAKKARSETGVVPFHTSDPCWDSHIDLSEGASYEIRLVTNGDWLDRAERADVDGFPTDNVLHTFAGSLKRWWTQDWFKPIARIGALGHDEYVLEPEAPPAHHDYANKHRAPEGASAGVIVVGTNPLQCDVSGSHLDALNSSQAACVATGDPTPSDRQELISKITAKTSGRLYLYVNDAYLSVMPNGVFYGNNTGCAQVIVSQILSDAERREIGKTNVCVKEGEKAPTQVTVR